MKLLDLEIFHRLWFQMLNLTVVHICILEKIDEVPDRSRKIAISPKSGTC